MVQAVHKGAMERGAMDIAEIAREYYACVYGFCARRIGPDAAADAAQETFVTAQRVLGSYRGDSPLKTWLLGIANNECRRLARKRRTEPYLLELQEPGGDSPESRLVDRHALQEALARLSAEHREAVILVELDGLTYDEAASVLGVPAGTVKSRVHHAFLNLRKSLFPVQGVAR